MMGLIEYPLVLQVYVALHHAEIDAKSRQFTFAKHPGILNKVLIDQFVAIGLATHLNNYVGELVKVIPQPS